MRQLLTLGATICIACLAWCGCDSQPKARDEAHLRGHTSSQMYSLQSWIFRAEALKPEAFSLIPTGTVIVATSLPSVISDTFPTEFELEELRDVWMRPFYLVLSAKVVATNVEDNVYELTVWSSGKNGLNEMGKGDDISLTFTNR